MKKLSIYYSCHICLNIVLLIAFYTYINLHILSLLPIFLTVLMFFQTTLLKVNTKNDTIGDTAYSVGNTVRLTEIKQIYWICNVKKGRTDYEGPYNKRTHL